MVEPAGNIPLESGSEPGNSPCGRRAHNAACSNTFWQAQGSISGSPPERELNRCDAIIGVQQPARVNIATSGNPSCAAFRYRTTANPSPVVLACLLAKNALW